MRNYCLPNLFSGEPASEATANSRTDSGSIRTEETSSTVSVRRKAFKRNFLCASGALAALASTVGGGQWTNNALGRYQASAANLPSSSSNSNSSDKNDDLLAETLFAGMFTFSAGVLSVFFIACAIKALHKRYRLPPTQTPTAC